MTRPTSQTEHVVADCACDPPLSSTERALAHLRARDLFVGLAALASRYQAARSTVLVRHADAEKSLTRCKQSEKLRVDLKRVVDAWPTRPPKGLHVSASALVEIADEISRRPARRYLSIAGAVHTPMVLAAPETATVRELVARAGGARPADWMAISGGLPAGRIVSRDESVAALQGARILLVLSSRHPLVRRLRLPKSALARRAASLCAGPRACLGCEFCAPLRPVDATLLQQRMGLGRFAAPPLAIEAF